MIPDRKTTLAVLDSMVCPFCKAHMVAGVKYAPFTVLYEWQCTNCTYQGSVETYKEGFGPK